MNARWTFTPFFCLILVCGQTQSSSQEVASPNSIHRGHTNRLIRESSPYLLLHAHNPVDWYPWGEEAIDRAKKEDKPIFLSVGYSTCYWCHVMEREVFSNPEIAKLMNDGFVNIKVDREERPDLDEIYMAATQLMRQSGGWPNSVFLTPDLEPFFAGTYFPPEDRAGMPGFPTVLRHIRDGWLSQREDIEESAGEVAELMRNMLADKRGQMSALPTLEDVDKVVETLVSRFDEDYGGFGGAPKFPSPANLYLLWDRAEQGDAEARRVVVETLRGMGRGAIYDQIGGGFHRYTLDEKWRIPHFEKMLYDNAHLAERLAVVAKVTKDPELERWARGTLEFTLREMRLENGAFKSAIDAETDGKEGAYYVWTADELGVILGKDGFELLAAIYGFDSPPNFEEDHYTLYLTSPLEEHAKRLGVTRRELLEKLEPHLAKLRSARAKRKYPLVDDKVLTDWNGMMITAMARAGQALGETRYIEAARGAASFVLAQLRAEDGTLRHTWRRGRAKVPAFLDDYAFLIQGLVALYDVRREKRWLDEAERLAEEMERRLGDPEGGYYFSEASPDLLFQPRSTSDGAVPSGDGVTILNLLELAERTGKPVYRQQAEACLRGYSADLRQFPAALRTVALAASRLNSSPATAATPTASESESLIYRLAEEVVTTNGKVIGPVLDDGWQPFELHIEIREGWHVNANPASLEVLTPTRIQGMTRNVHYPEGVSLKFGFSEDELYVYRGEVAIPGEVGPGDHQLTLIYQACDDRRCLPAVETTVELRR